MSNSLVRKKCFFCTTPFQIMTAIILVRRLNILADLYVVPQFSTAYELANKIKKQNIFDNVVYVDTSKIEKYKKSKSKIGLYTGIIKNYIRINSVVESFFPKNQTYESIFVSSKANVGRLVILYLYKHDILPTIHYFDDGESSYDNWNLTNASSWDNLIRRIVFGKGVLSIDAKDSFLYSEELYRKLNPESRLQIKQIPLPTNSDISSLRRCFSVTKEKLIEEKVIILDLLKDENLEQSELQKLLHIYEIIIEKFGKENVIIKRHPRDQSEAQHGVRYYTEYSVPFELLCCDNSINNKVLITAGSTAIVLSKLFFGRESYVVRVNHWVCINFF